MTRDRMTRRRFLGKAAAVAAGLGVLGLGAQCGATPTPEIVEVEKVVKETVEVVKEVEVEKEVTKVVEKVVEVAPKGPKVVNVMQASWVLQEIPMDRMARLYNEAHRGEMEIRLSATVSGWDTKVLKMQEDNELIFNGSLISGVPQWIAREVAIGMIAPWEDFIAASKEAGADRIKKPDMIPIVYDDHWWLGHMWGIPYSFENISYNWRTDYYRQVGWEKAPVTWAEKKEVAIALKEKLGGEGVVPFSWVGSWECDFGAELYSSTKEPFTDIKSEKKGFVMHSRASFQSPEAIEAFNWMRSWVEEDLVPPHGSDDWWPLYQKGKLACVQAQSSRGVWGQKIHGQANVMTSPVPEKTVGAGCGTNYWDNSPTLFRLAPYPQEHVDFNIYAIGPANEDMQKAIIESGKTPVYEWCYSDLIEKDPNFATYLWMVAMRDQVQNSYPLWPDTYTESDFKFYSKWMVMFMEKGSKMTAEELGKTIEEEVTAELESMTFRVDRVDGIIGGLKWTY